VKDGQYFIVEAKYTGTAKLGTTSGNVRQMSDTWITSNNRLQNAVGSSVADDILSSGYTRLLAEVAPDGSVVYRMLGGEGASVTKLDIITP
jgi:hypothetical protein